MKKTFQMYSHFNKKSQEFQRRPYDYKYVSDVLFLMPMLLVHKNPLNGEEDNITSAHRKKKKADKMDSQLEPWIHVIFYILGILWLETFLKSKQMWAKMSWINGFANWNKLSKPACEIHIQGGRRVDNFWATMWTSVIIVLVTFKVSYTGLTSSPWVLQLSLFPLESQIGP